MFKIKQSVSTQFSFVADGTSTSFSVDLSVAPVNQNFNGNLPIDVESYSDGTGLVQSTSVDGTTLIVNYVSAPTAGSYTATVTLAFNGR